MFFDANVTNWKGRYLFSREGSIVHDVPLRVQYIYAVNVAPQLVGLSSKVERRRSCRVPSVDSGELRLFAAIPEHCVLELDLQLFMR